MTPHVNDVPFSMSGQGEQASIKISLAMSRHADKANIVMIEEPENHLSHTSLTTLLARIEKLAGDQQQLFIYNPQYIRIEPTGTGLIDLDWPKYSDKDHRA